MNTTSPTIIAVVAIVGIVAIIIVALFKSKDAGKVFQGLMPALTGLLGIIGTFYFTRPEVNVEKDKAKAAESQTAELTDKIDTLVKVFAAVQQNVNSQLQPAQVQELKKDPLTKTALTLKPSDVAVTRADGGATLSPKLHALLETYKANRPDTQPGPTKRRSPAAGYR